MSNLINHQELDAALHRCGSNWNASQAHGLICSRLAVQGPDVLDQWLGQVLENTDSMTALQMECAAQLRALHDDTYRQLSERGSEFQLLVPDESAGTAARTEAMALWCEGFLHGLVVRAEGDRLKKRLGSEPISDIIKDMLEITRAEADEDAESESNEVAYAELLEYLRVAAQLVYEELAEFRRPAGSEIGSKGPTNHVH